MQAAIFVDLTHLFLQASDGVFQQMLFHFHSVPGVQEQKEVMATLALTPKKPIKCGSFQVHIMVGVPLSKYVVFPSQYEELHRPGPAGFV